MGAARRTARPQGEGGATMLGDYAAPDREFRAAVARQFDSVAERFEKMGEVQQQQTLVLTEMRGQLKAITETLTEQKQEQRAAPMQVQGWLVLACSAAAVGISLLSLLASHVSFH